MRNYNHLQRSDEIELENVSAHNYYPHIVSACNPTKSDFDDYGPVTSMYNVRN